MRLAFVCSKGCGRDVKGIYCDPCREGVEAEAERLAEEMKQQKRETMARIWLEQRVELLKKQKEGRARARRGEKG